MRRAAILVLGLAASLAMPGLVMGEGDWEYWSQYEIAWKAAEDVQFRLKPEFRFRDDVSKHYHTHVQIGMDWKFRDWLVLGAYYRHISAESGGNWKTEKRPHANAVFAWKIKALSFSDRNRLEYRIKPDKRFFRYVNRLSVKLPRMGPVRIQPFFREEVYYDFDADEFCMNRAYGGFNIGVVSGLNVDVYYILESIKRSDDWERVNILATALKYGF